MAVLDHERGAVVIRIVYDGPPHAGKTTSVRSLARSLSRHVETPLEAEGRTLFFDWMEYTGGLFEGHQIRCQIVTVPGQPDLAARRRALLETADVVIFVADTADREAVERSAGHIRQMADILGSHADPPIGIVVQANKRDLPGALPRADVADAIGEDFTRTAITESVAETGVGIRETFVLAVRLALDRIRELMMRGELPLGKPSADTADQLLATLERLPSAHDLEPADLEPADLEPVDLEPTELDGEALIQASTDDGTTDRIEVVNAMGNAIGNGTSNGVPSQDAYDAAGNGFAHGTSGFAQPHARNGHRKPSGTSPMPPRPRLPDARVPSGAIWPPVEGRMVLHEAATSGLILHRVGNADWIAGMGTGWRVHSSGAATFDQFEAGRDALLNWAKLHSTYGALLSPSRCVVLAEAGGETWRLWQIVKLAPSLRAWIVDGAELAASELFGRLTTAAKLLGEAHARCADTRLLATLDSIGRAPAGAQFVALMPAPTAGPAPRPPDVAERIARELSRMLAAELIERRAELAELIDSSEGWRTPWDDLVASAIARNA